jgi:hypothetical protein
MCAIDTKVGQEVWLSVSRVPFFTHAKKKLLQNSVSKFFATGSKDGGMGRSPSKWLADKERRKGGKYQKKHSPCKPGSRQHEKIS